MVMVSVLYISLRTSHVLQGAPAQPKLYRFGQMFAADPLRTGETAMVRASFMETTDGRSAAAVIQSAPQLRDYR